MAGVTRNRLWDCPMSRQRRRLPVTSRITKFARIRSSILIRPDKLVVTSFAIRSVALPRAIHYAWTHMFNPNLILDVRAGYAGRPGVDSSQQNQHAAGIDPLKQFGFGDIDKYGGLLVRLDTNEWTAGSNNDFGVRGAALRENPNWSVTPNLTWIRGNHNLKFGAWYIEAKRIQLNTFQRYTFSDEQTRNPSAASGSTGLSLASALLGFPNNFDAQLPTLHGGPVQFKYASWAAFGQDEWRVRRNLVLTLGLRYDYLTQPKT